MQLDVWSDIRSKASKTAWMFKDNISSWTWAGHENQIALVDVYSSGDEVETFLKRKITRKKGSRKEEPFYGRI